MTNEAFYLENDRSVTKTLVKILLGMTVIFPLMWLLSGINVFSYSNTYLIIMTCVGCFVTLTPIILFKLGLNPKFLKYYCIIAIQTVVTVMGACTFGIYMTYALTLLFSCMYFSVKFTVFSGILGYIGLALGVWFSSPFHAAAQLREATEYFSKYFLGYTIEYAAMFAVAITVAIKAKKVLDNLSDAEKTMLLMKTSGEASIKLSKMLGVLAEAVRVGKINNENITLSADDTTQKCENNLSSVTDTVDKIERMSELLDSISQKTEIMSQVSEETTQSTDECVNVISSAISSMQNIDDATKTTRTCIDELAEKAVEIDRFTQTITSIASKTNILALNAAIEAARAGEHGSGFAVVADEVKNLAMQSREASNNITHLIAEIKKNISDAENAVQINESSVNSGLGNIKDAGTVIEKLNELQKTSSEKVSDIVEHCQSSKNYGENILSASNEIKQYTEISLDSIKKIADSTISQTKSIDDIAASLDEITDISDKLLKISTTE